MKKLVLLIGIALVCFSCKQKGLYEIEGTVSSPDMEGKYVYLVKYNDEGIEKCDSSVIKNGKFFFEGVQEVPELYYIQTGDEETTRKRAILLEPGNIVVTISDRVVIAGTLVNDAYQKYLDEQFAIDTRLNGVATDQEYDSVYKEKKESYTKYFSENINNPLGVEEFGIYGRRLEPEQLKFVLSKGNEAFKASETGIFYQERLEAVQKTAIGQKFVDIVSKDTTGKAISLSDYAGKGKYVLVDFWASWCGPCREEMPMMVELYKKYRYRKFEIVGFSLDKNAEAWIRGLESLGMTWPQMSDVNFWQSEPVKNYAVPHIPYTVLIDPAGIILAKGLIGDELKNKLEELFK